jgi:hypothetical protein
MVCERRVYPFPNQLLYVNMLKLAEGAIALREHFINAYLNTCKITLETLVLNKMLSRKFLDSSRKYIVDVCLRI